MRYRITSHPLVSRDLRGILLWIADYAGASVALEKIEEITDTIDYLRDTPHTGSLRDDVAPRLRAIAAAKKAVIAFTVDDALRTVRIICITYGGADWARRSRARLR